MTVTVPNQPYFLYNKFIKAMLNIHQIDNGLTHILSVFLFVFRPIFFLNLIHLIDAAISQTRR